MRLFELLLLLSNTGLLAVWVFARKAKRIPKDIAALASTVLLLLHLIIEGWRVQSVLSYCITVVFSAVSIYSYIIKTSKWEKTSKWRLSRFWSGCVYAVMAMSLLLTAVLIYLFPVFKLPKPTGEWQVGTQTLHFIDMNREEIFGDTQGSRRELMVQLWYPAQNANGKTAPFMPEGSKMLREDPLSKEIGIPGVFMNGLESIPSHSYEGAEVLNSGSPFPLVLLNHGYGSSKVYHTSQAENLASHGYIVASIDHTYSTYATVFPDGSTTTMKTDKVLIEEAEYRDKVGKVWTEDISFILDQLELVNSGRISSSLQDKLDLRHVGVFGHSFGGAASYDALHDSRVVAGIDMDGSLYGYDKAGAAKPFMYMFSEDAFQVFDKVRQGYIYTDEELNALGVTREQIEEETTEAKHQVKHLRMAARRGGPIVYIENTRHYNFADLQFVTPLYRFVGLTGDIDPARSASIVNAYTLEFFDKYLKNKDGRLLDGPSGDYPEVKFVTSLYAEGS